MDRFFVALLAACALIGASLSSPPEPQPGSASAVAVPAQASLPAVSAPAPEEDADAVVVRQILERFSVRHTALPERERRRLARVIVAEARAHDLDPDLVMAVIEVESAGYHLAESHVGALGLMQLLPPTGKEMAERVGIDWKGPDTLFDPVINVRLGTAYLRELADKYEGNVNTALAAYNWGPGRIDRRLARGKSVPKLYVEQVRRAADRYAATSTSRS
ncbi:MAG: lytic transglycosylase domain-containing protein [bacterium]|nr:lytic transglycosylase domain-containing protein [bacterium]